MKRLGAGLVTFCVIFVTFNAELLLAEERTFGMGRQGNGCLWAGQCKSDICYLGRCVDCLTDEDCDSKEYCSTSTVIYPTCIGQAEDGDVCDRDRMCSFGSTCCDLECSSECDAILSEGAHCTAFSQCEGQVCQDGLCGGCQSDSDCEAGFYCEQSAPGPLCLAAQSNGSVCDRDSMCESGSSCCDLVCSSSCNSILSAGDHCTSSSQCQGGNCTGGVCTGCESELDCHPLQYCELTAPGPLCLDRRTEGDVCSSDLMCESGTECCDLTCTANCNDILPAGASCTQNTQCQGRQCVNGVCVGCLSDCDCEADEYCDDTHPGPICLPDKAEGGLCDRDGMCADGLECCDLTCLSSCGGTLPGGANCTNDSQCQGYNCTDGVCLGCQDDNDCVGNQYCEQTNFNGVNNASICVDAQGNGTSCDRDEMCLDGLQCCDYSCNNTCSGLPEGEFCTSSSQCEFGCHGGVCSGCNTHNDCDSDEFCEENSPGPLCMQKYPNGSPCETNYQCESSNCCGYTCQETCYYKLPLNSYCQDDDAYCQSGYCYNNYCQCKYEHITCGGICYSELLDGGDHAYSTALCRDNYTVLAYPSNEDESHCVKLIADGQQIWLGFEELDTTGQFRNIYGDPLSYTEWTLSPNLKDSSPLCIGMLENGEWQTASCNETYLVSSTRESPDITKTICQTY